MSRLRLVLLGVGATSLVAGLVLSLVVGATFLVLAFAGFALVVFTVPAELVKGTSIQESIGPGAGGGGC